MYHFENANTAMKRTNVSETDIPTIPACERPEFGDESTVARVEFGGPVGDEDVLGEIVVANGDAARLMNTMFASASGEFLVGSRLIDVIC